MKLVSKKLFKYILNFIPRPLLIRLSYIVRPVLAFVLRGKKYTDPIDGKSFKSFLPYGYGKQRPNVLSPSTLSLERHRLLWLFLKNEYRTFIFLVNTKLKMFFMLTFFKWGVNFWVKILVYIS